MVIKKQDDLENKQSVDVPVSILQDKEQLEQACIKAQEQIRAIESKITIERENWYQKIKQKEEEGITLKAQIDSIIFRSDKERAERESELSLLQHQIQTDLAEVERVLGDEVKSWTEKISQKEKDLEETRNQSVFLEAQKKMELERNIRGLQSTLEQSKQKSKNLDRQLLEEKNQWLSKLKNQEEEIINLKTQISLRETKLKIEEDRDRSVRKDLESNWHNQINEMQTKLENNKAEWQNALKSKEEELFGLRSALEQRLNSIRLETDNQEKEILNLQARVNDRIRIVEQHLADEKKRWQAALKVRDDEYKQLKVELVLKESQDKADREKRYIEFKEEEQRVNRQLKDIKQKIEDEKNNWDKKVSAKEEEIKLFKIQAELKLRDVKEMWDKRRNQLEQEKGGYEGRLAELNKKIVQEKEDWEKKLELKNIEIIQYQNEWKKRQNEIAENEKRELEDFRSRKDVLKKDIAKLESELKNESSRWKELVKQKEGEIESLKNQLVLQESQANRDIANLEAQLNKEHEPVIKQINELESKITQISEQAAREISKKEAQKRVLEQEAQRKDEFLRDKLAKQLDKIKSEEEIFNLRIDNIRSSIEQETKNGIEQLESLKNQENDIRQKIVSIEGRVEVEKNSIKIEYETKKTEMAQVVEKLEKEIADSQNRFENAISQKNEEISKETGVLTEIEEKYSSELIRCEQDLKNIKVRGDEQVKLLGEELEKVRVETSKSIKGKEEDVAKQQEILKTGEERLNHEREKLRARHEEEYSLLLGKRNDLEKAVEKVKRESEEVLLSASKKLIELKQKQTAKNIEHDSMKTLWREKLAQVRNEYDRKTDDLKNQIQSEIQNANEILDNFRKEKQTLNAEISVITTKMQADKSKLNEEYETRKNVLEETIRHVEKDKIELEAKFRSEIEFKLKEVESEEKTLHELDARNKNEGVAKEEEYKVLIVKGQEDVKRLTQEVERLKKIHAENIRIKEDDVNKLKETLSENEIKFRSELQELELRRKNDIKPLLEKKSDLEKVFDTEKKKGIEQLGNAQKKIDSLKQLQSLKETEFASIQNLYSDKISALKAEYQHELSILEHERTQVESDYNKRIVYIEQESRKIEQDVKGRQDLFNEKKLLEEQKARNTILGLKEEIQRLQSEINRINEKYPQEIKVKQEEIDSLENQLKERVGFYQQEQERAEKGLENFERRSERKLAAMRAQLEQLKQRHQADLDAAEKRFAAIRVELEGKESAQRQEYLEEEKKYLEQRQKLEIQKKELEESLKDLKNTSQEVLREKEKELLSLQSELSEKEKQLEQSWKEKESELEHEKSLIVEELEVLNKRIQEEEQISVKKIAEKEHEIQKYQAQYSNRTKSLVDEAAHKKAVLEEVNGRLMYQVKELTKNLADLQAGFNESRSAKEKELSVLKSNLEFWELRAKAEEEKRISNWEEEKSTFESEIKEAQKKLNDIQKEYAYKIEEKEKLAAKIQSDFSFKEEEQLNLWKTAELGLIQKRDDLLNDIALWEKRIKDETQAAESKNKELEREIERLKLEGALKENELSSLKSKAEREWIKVQRKLKDDLSALMFRLSEEKDIWANRLHMKDEEIATLQKRLALREERRQSEIIRRNDEVRKIVEDLKQQLISEKNKYNEKLPAKKEIFEKLQADLDVLVNENKMIEDRWSTSQEQQHGNYQELYRKLSSDILNLEEEIKNESRRLEQLFIAKEKQIQNLSAQMPVKEAEYQSERDFTQRTMAKMNSKVQELKKELNRETPKNTSHINEEMGKLFETGVTLYSTADYLKAKSQFESVIKKYPDFAAAYQYLAICEWNIGNEDAALKMANTALELEPQNEELKAWIETARESKHK